MSIEQRTDLLSRTVRMVQAGNYEPINKDVLEKLAGCFLKDITKAWDKVA